MFINKMKSLKIIPLLFAFFAFPLNEFLVQAGNVDTQNYKVLSTNNKNLSIANVDYYLREGDEFIKNGDFDEAKDSYLDARKLASNSHRFIPI